MIKGRRRIVVEEIAVVGGDDERVAGRLLDELSRIRALYDGVNESDSSPLSVGVKAMEDLFSQGVELGQFLSVSADDLGATLDDVVATKATIPIIGIQLPIGTLASIFGRLARGPRLRGTLDHAGANGTTLRLELVGGARPQRWSVAGTDVDAMLAELAVRVFNDLSLGGATRWKAIRAFNEYLELVSESHRLTNLRRAEDKLLEAIAEDQRFDLAFYNLGVVYSLLADTERAAAECSEHTSPSDRPLEGYHGRLVAARAAFERTSALDRDRTGPVYALAVHRFTRTEDLDVDGLVEIVELFTRVIELEPGHAQAHDLRGMALLGLGQTHASEASHPDRGRGLAAPAPQRGVREARRPAGRAGSRARRRGEPRRGAAQPRRRQLRPRRAGPPARRAPGAGRSPVRAGVRACDRRHEGCDAAGLRRPARAPRPARPRARRLRRGAADRPREPGLRGQPRERVRRRGGLAAGGGALDRRRGARRPRRRLPPDAATARLLGHGDAARQHADRARAHL